MRSIPWVLVLITILFVSHARPTPAAAPDTPATPPIPKMSKLPANAVAFDITAADASGQEPSEFLVLAGIPAGSTAAEFEKRTGRAAINWQPHTARIGKDGQYLWPLDRAYDAMYLRLETDGYQPQIAGPIKKSDGPQRVEFRLQPDRQVAARVLTPDRKPAAGAIVALALPQKDAVLEDGSLRGAGQPLPEKPGDRWRRPLLVKTDESGRFKLPTEPGPAVVLIIHESGVLEVAFDEFQKSPELVLKRWGKIEGRVVWKDKPGAGDEVTLSAYRDQYGYPGMIASYASTHTDNEGRFTFSKALPGRTQISRPTSVAKPGANGVTQVILPTQLIHVDVRAGEPTRVVLGGQGRLVHGKLTGRNSWKDVTLRVHPTAPHIGFPGDDTAWQAFGELQTSPIGPLLFRDKLPVNADGTFEIPDMLPGDYQLFVSAPDVQNNAGYRSITVDPEVLGAKPPAIDLGEIKVKSPP